MVKKPLMALAMLISTVALAGLISLPTQAMGEFKSGLKYWTVQDIIDYGLEVETERNALCGDDIACKEQYYRENMNGGENRPKFQNFDRFNSVRVWLTSINPSTGEAKFLYQGADGWELGQGHEVVLKKLKELYIVWLEDEAIDEYYSGSWVDPAHNHYVPYYVDKILSGEPSSDTYEIFSYNISRDGLIEYPNRTEISFTIPSSANLDANTRGEVFLSSVIGGLYTYSTQSYGSCINSPYYKEGMECRLVFSEDYIQRMVPFTKDGILAEIAFETNNEVKDEAEVELRGEIEDEIEAENGEEIEGEIIEYEVEIMAEIKNEPTRGFSLPAIDEGDYPIAAAPNTGQLTFEEAKTPIFPWWLGVLLGLNGLILLWFLLPFNKKPKKCKKVPKKY